MPRDEWANARAKDAARRTLSATHDVLDTRPPSKRRRKPQKKRRGRTPKPTIKPCPKCGSIETCHTMVLFKDNTRHIELRCKDCGRFIKYVKGGGYRFY
jgi:hypothetical protein